MQLDAEFQEACEQHDCPLLLVVRANWFEGRVNARFAACILRFCTSLLLSTISAPHMTVVRALLAACRNTQM
jgi:hypothetical protein